MRKIAATVLLCVFALSACGQAPWEDSLKDVEGAPVRDPDYVMLTNNVDQHPNVVLICTGGFGFYTTTRDDFSAIDRLPEMDAFCEEVEGEGSQLSVAGNGKPDTWNELP